MDIQAAISAAGDEIANGFDQCGPLKSIDLIARAAIVAFLERVPDMEPDIAWNVPSRILAAIKEAQP